MLLLGEGVMLTNYGKFPDTHGLALSGLCLLAFEEYIVGSDNPLAASSDGELLTKQCLSPILEHLFLRDARMISIAIDCLGLYCQCYEVIPRIPDSALELVAERLIGAVRLHLDSQLERESTSGTSRDEVGAMLLGALLEWVMILPQGLLYRPKLTKMLFEMLDVILTLNSPMDPPGSGKAVQDPVTPRTAGLQPSKSMFDFAQAISSGKKHIFSTKPKSSETESSDVRSIGSDSDVLFHNSHMKEAAENLLAHLVHQLNNFPGFAGPAQVGSLVNEFDDPLAQAGDDQNALYFVYEDTTLISFVEKPGRQVRVIVRDITGKYCWDSELFYDAPNDWNIQQLLPPEQFEYRGQCAAFQFQQAPAIPDEFSDVPRTPR